MRRLAGQALRGCRGLFRLLVPVVLLLSLALGGLAWRLAQAPLPIPGLAAQIERSAAGSLAGLHLEVGRAAIAWEGWHSGAAAPIDFRLDAVRLRDGGGLLRADLPEVAFTLSVPALLRGRLAPSTLELRKPSLHLSREPDGSFSIGTTPDVPAETTAAADAGSAVAGETPIEALLATLHGAGAGSIDAADAPLASLRRLRLRGGAVQVLDRAQHRGWSLAGTDIDIRRSAAGALSAQGEATLRSGGMAVPIRLDATMPPRPSPPRLALTLALSDMQPQVLARMSPALLPLAMLDAPVALTASATLDESGTPRDVEARFSAGAGALLPAGGPPLPFTRLEARLAGDAKRLRLSEAALHFGAAGRLTVHAAGHAVLGEAGWVSGLDLQADPFAVTELAAAWPGDLAPRLRQPAMAALGAGQVDEARMQLRLRSATDLADLRVEEVRIALGIEAMLLHLGAASRVAAPDAFAPGTEGGDSLAPDTSLALERLELATVLAPGQARIERLALRLPASGGAPGPTLLADAAARRAADGAAWQAEATLRLETVRFADLPRLWPAGLRNDERKWITESVTAGELRNGIWRLAGTVMTETGGVDLTAFSGSADAVDTTVHWLRPVPPLVGLTGTATFSANEIVVRGRGGRQQTAEPAAAAAEAARGNRQPGGRAGRPNPGAARAPDVLEVREGTVRLFDFDASPNRAEVDAQVAGPLTEVLSLLRHPRLKLFEKQPLELNVAAGQAEARLQLGFPLLDQMPMDTLRITANGKVSDARLTDILLGQDLAVTTADVAVDTAGLKATGQGVMADAPARLDVEMDFRPGPPTQVVQRVGANVSRVDRRMMEALGADPAGLFNGTLALDARFERRRGGQGMATLRGDLRDAALAIEAVGWAKPAGTSGQFEATLRLSGDQLTAVDAVRLEAPNLLLRGRVLLPSGGRLDRVEIEANSRIGATRFGGDISRPRREGGPWAIALRGSLLDLQPILAHRLDERGAAHAPRAAAPPRTGPPFTLQLHFDRATTGEGRDLHGVEAHAHLDGLGILHEASASGRTARAAGTGAFQLTLAPHGRERSVRMTAADGGALLRALDVTDAISGGRLSLTASLAELRPGSPVAGTAELDEFVVRNAPVLGKVLQAVTLFGLVEALQGGSGLVFSRLIAPFTLTGEALALQDARAFSASLGLTAKGHVWRHRGTVDLEGTVVPAYLLNQMLGHVPLIGRLFSPERGGGVFAAAFRVQGPLGDPQVSMNPLTALTPGFLRGLFGLAESGRGAQPPIPGDR